MDLIEDGEAIKEERRILSVVMTDELIVNISKALKNTTDNAKLISAIAEIKPYTARGDNYNPENRMYPVIVKVVVA